MCDAEKKKKKKIESDEEEAEEEEENRARRSLLQIHDKIHKETQLWGWSSVSSGILLVLLQMIFYRDVNRFCLSSSILSRHTRHADGAQTQEILVERKKKPTRMKKKAQE